MLRDGGPHLDKLAVHFVTFTKIELPFLNITVKNQGKKMGIDIRMDRWVWIFRKKTILNHSPLYYGAYVHAIDPEIVTYSQTQRKVDSFSPFIHHTQHTFTCWCCCFPLTSDAKDQRRTNQSKIIVTRERNHLSLTEVIADSLSIAWNSRVSTNSYTMKQGIQINPKGEGKSSDAQCFLHACVTN